MFGKHKENRQNNGSERASIDECTCVTIDRDQRIRLNTCSPARDCTLVLYQVLENSAVRRNGFRILHASGVDKFSYSGVLSVQTAPGIVNLNHVFLEGCRIKCEEPMLGL